MSEFLGSVSVQVLLGMLALFALLVAVIAYFWPVLKHRVQGYPHEEELEGLLEPYIFKAIMSAYRLSEFAVDEVEERIRGLDKKAIALTLYDLLPAQIGKYNISIIKALVSREMFAGFIQNVFDKFDEEFVEQQEHFQKVLNEWVSANIGSNVSIVLDDAIEWYNE